MVLPGMKNTILEVLGITVEKKEKNLVELTMPVDSRTHQPFGLLHGGASVVLAESAASIGAHMNLDSPGKAAVGLEINANHIRSVKEGTVRARAVPLHLGKTTMVWDIKIVNEKEKLVCVSRCTLSIIDV